MLVGDMVMLADLAADPEMDMVAVLEVEQFFGIDLSDWEEME